jgi:hypothetical protein
MGDGELQKTNILLRQTKSYGGQVERRTGLRAEATTRQAPNIECAVENKIGGAAKTHV